MCLSAPMTERFPLARVSGFFKVRLLSRRADFFFLAGGREDHSPVVASICSRHQLVRLLSLEIPCRPDTCFKDTPQDENTPNNPQHERGVSVIPASQMLRSISACARRRFVTKGGLSVLRDCKKCFNSAIIYSRSQQNISGASQQTLKSKEGLAKFTKTTEIEIETKQQMKQKKNGCKKI